jgi:hypothetical protein
MYVCTYVGITKVQLIPPVVSYIVLRSRTMLWQKLTRGFGKIDTDCTYLGDGQHAVGFIFGRNLWFSQPSNKPTP